MNKDLLYASLFTEATLGILVVNQNGEIVAINPYCEQLFGYESNSLLNKKIEVLLPDALRQRHVKHRNNYLEKPNRRSMGKNLSLHGLKKNGDIFPVEVSLSYIREDGALYAIAYVSDDSLRSELIDQKIKNEKRLEEYSESLEEMVEARTNDLLKKEVELKLALQKERELGELKSRFVSMASHEFRTPLSTILSSSSLIGKYENTVDQGKRQKHIDRIQSSVRNLTSILNDFLSLEKLESGKITKHAESWLVFDEFISQLVEEVSLTAKEGQKIEFTSEGDSIVFISEPYVRNILINLLSNALKYSPNQSIVTLLAKVDNDILSIDVIDRGFGIPKNEQQHLFTRFFRANNVQNIKGTGLGLTIVKRYLDLLGGSISFSSKEGEGTTFSVSIPAKHKPN